MTIIDEHGYVRQECCQSYKNPSARPNISKFLQQDEFRPRTADLSSKVKKRLQRPDRVQSAKTDLHSMRSKKTQSFSDLEKEQCPVYARTKINNSYWNKNLVIGRHILDLTDTELDLFISQVVPNDQYIIIFAYRNNDKINKTLREYHHDTNKLRSKPCNQSKLDMFRIFKYDLNKNTLLIKRHNITQGSFLIYRNGRLIWMGQKFNGYSTNLWDLKRQLEILQKVSKNGRFDRSGNAVIPPDFKYQAGDRVQPVIEVGGDVFQEDSSLVFV